MPEGEDKQEMQNLWTESNQSSTRYCPKRIGGGYKNMGVGF